MKLDKTDVTVTFRKTGRGLDRHPVVFQTAFQILTLQADAPEQNIGFRHSGAAIDGLEQFLFGFVIFLLAHETDRQVIVGISALRVSGDGCALLGDIVFCVFGFWHGVISFSRQIIQAACA